MLRGTRPRNLPAAILAHTHASLSRRNNVYCTGPLSGKQGRADVILMYSTCKAWQQWHILVCGKVNKENCKRWHFILLWWWSESLKLKRFVKRTTLHKFYLKLATINDSFEKIKDWYNLRVFSPQKYFSHYYSLLYTAKRIHKWKLASNALYESTRQGKVRTF